LAYNDQSLPRGGKFDLDAGWSEANRQHAEHRVGINCDVRSNNVDGTRWTKLNDIFRARGSTRTNDETGTNAPHWHLRFEFGTQVARVRTTAASLVPENWWGAVNHAPTDDDWAYWTGRISGAQAQGQSQTVAEVKAFNRSLFYSDEYVARSRSDEDFVADLYVTYLQREHDQGGFNFWLGVLRNDNASGVNGREHLLRAFEESGEFAEVVASLDAMAAPEEPTLCDTAQEQSCYNQGGTWDSTNCSCTVIPEPEPEPDPCYAPGTSNGSENLESGTEGGPSKLRPIC